MTRTVHGKIHGKSIELDEDPGLAEGQVVELTIHTVTPPTGRRPGEGFLRTEGAPADDPYWDGIMEEIYRERRGFGHFLEKSR